VLHHYHSCPITQEGALTPGNDASEEPSVSLLLIDVLRSLPGSVAELLLAGLCLIFKDLEGPNDPIGHHGSCSRSEKLSYFIVEDASVPAERV
jgi:hypothetical protein